MIPKEEKWDSHTVSSKCMVENKPCHVLRDEWANKRTKGKRVGIPVFSPSGMKPRVRNKCTPAQPELVVDYNSWAWVEKPSFPNKDCLCELTSFAELWDSLCGNEGAKWSFLFFFFFFLIFFFLIISSWGTQIYVFLFFLIPLWQNILSKVTKFWPWNSNYKLLSSVVNGEKSLHCWIQMYSFSVE